MCEQRSARVTHSGRLIEGILNCVRILSADNAHSTKTVLQYRVPDNVTTLVVIPVGSLCFSQESLWQSRKRSRLCCPDDGSPDFKIGSRLNVSPDAANSRCYVMGIWTPDKNHPDEGDVPMPCRGTCGLPIRQNSTRTRSRRPMAEIQCHKSHG